MKTPLHVIVVGLVLSCAVASAQETSTDLVTAPLAGATVFDFRGTVSVQIPGQRFTSPARGEVLPPETTVNTGDGRMLLRLADGSDVVVRPHTRLLLKEEETGSWGYLKLLIGRINAQIKKHLGGTPPLQIGTPSAVISVRGTCFEVEVDSRGMTQVDVEEGVVALDSTNGESVLVTAGFSSRVSFESAPEVPRPTPDLRPQLERPEYRKGRDPRNDDPMAKLAAADPARRRKKEHNAELYETEGANRPSAVGGAPSATTPTIGRDH